MQKKKKTHLEAHQMIVSRQSLISILPVVISFSYFTSSYSCYYFISYGWYICVWYNFWKKNWMENKLPSKKCCMKTVIQSSPLLWQVCRIRNPFFSCYSILFFCDACRIGFPWFWSCRHRLKGRTQRRLCWKALKIARETCFFLSLVLPCPRETVWRAFVNYAQALFMMSHRQFRIKMIGLF